MRWADTDASEFTMKPFIVCLLALVISACADPCRSTYTHGETTRITVGSLTFERRAFTQGICGPAFVRRSALQANGEAELIVSNFHKQVAFTVPDGSLRAFTLNADLTDWTQRAIFEPEDAIKWPNATRVADLNADGRQDVIVGTGFLTCQLVPWTAPCGGLIWFEQTPDGWVRHDVISPGNERFIHEAARVDVDQDGDLDLVSVLESMKTPFGTDYAAEVIWFEALEPGRFATEPHRIGDGLGSLVEPHDVDGDGDVDLISGEYFAGLGASYTWMEQVEAPSSDQPAGVWVRHLIDDQSGPSIQFTLIEDLFGDGVTRGVGSNHTNTTSNPDDPASEVAVYTPTADPRAPWTKQVISDDIISRPGTGVAAPGIFGYGDADNDGDIDLVVSGDGDPRIFLFEQTAPGEFVQHTLETNLGQAGGMLIEDFDGDGDNELLVTGYEDNVLFIYSQP